MGKDSFLIAKAKKRKLTGLPTFVKSVILNNALLKVGNPYNVIAEADIRTDYKLHINFKFSN
jgi:hypothetical protein